MFVLSFILALSLSFAIMWNSDRLLQKISTQQKNSGFWFQSGITPSLSMGVKYVIIPFLLLILFLSLSISAVLVSLLPPIFLSNSEKFEQVSINWPDDLSEYEPQGTKFWEIAVSECLAKGHKRFRVTPEIKEHPQSIHKVLTFYIIEVGENDKWKALMSISHQDFSSFFRVGKFLSSHDRINYNFTFHKKAYNLKVISQGEEESYKNIRYQKFLAEINEDSKR